ncbi:MAG: DUF533 domain-containing protein [Methyloprofundus sp.]|nr:DUF533 domain-containing protein [Methyloprofundus sp.]
MIEHRFGKYMAGLNDLVGVLLTSGMIPSGDTRLSNAMNSSGLRQKKGLPLNKPRGVTNRSFPGINANFDVGKLASLFKVTTTVAGFEKQKSYSSQLTAPPSLVTFTDILFRSKSKGSTKGSSFEGGMAMLAVLVLQAFKNMDRQPVTAISNNKIPLGLRAPVNAVEEKELEQIATLVLKGMINAAKAGNRMGDEETQKVIVRIRMSGSNEDVQQLIFTEMQRPLDLDGLVNDIPNEAVAAQVYAASLFAMEADTSSERRYLEQFVQRTGLDIGVAEQIKSAVGMRRVGVYF